LERGLLELRGLGFEPVVSDAILEQRGFTAGSAERRLAELYSFFEDRSVAGVFAARGGAGIIQLLPSLDVARLVAHPKLLLGYSDLTFLHVLLNNAGLVTFHGPMLARELADENYDRESLLAAASGDVDHTANETADLLALSEGRAEGRLLGGCLSILCAGLGTPWALRAPGDEDEKTLLFLEDVNEAPYRIDRMLRQLRAASVLDRVSGILFGEMVGCWPDAEAEYTLEDVILEALDGLEIPIAIGFPSGHCPRGVTLPLGVRACLECGGDAGRFEILESGVA
jgi:muramoyltetrapeptide carboxypeptidase